MAGMAARCMQDARRERPMSEMYGNDSVDDEDQLQSEDTLVDRGVSDVLDDRGLREATICGISYGGLIAAAFAARHPDRVSALILMSAIPPSWRPDRRAAFLMRAPMLLSPLFCVGSLRMCPEIFAARGTLPGVAFTAQHVGNVFANMFSPRLMARRARLVAALDLQGELERVTRPTLVITGEASLDNGWINARLCFARIGRATSNRSPRSA